MNKSEAERNPQKQEQRNPQETKMLKIGKPSK